MPIENVQVGDRVLSQDPLSGELTFKPVLDITVGHQDFFALSTTEREQLVRDRRTCLLGFGRRLAA